METGTIIPDILGTDQDGNIIRRSDYPGRSIALYFYPKDSTSGCTAQACNLRDNYQSLLDAGYQVIGVSVDSADSHKKFIAKNSLPFPLITDTDHKLVTEFGVWGEKPAYGMGFMGIIRSTFIINKEGEVVKSWFNVNVEGHVEEVLKALEELHL